MDRSKFRLYADPLEVKNVLLDRSGDKLAHAMGHPYATATQWCLNCNLDSDLGDTSDNQRVIKAFKRNVIEALQKKAGFL